MRVSNCPARPTYASPCLSSSYPGASPTKTSRASGLPWPKTVCVRVLFSPHRVHPRTNCSSSTRRRRPRSDPPGSLTGFDRREATECMDPERFAQADVLDRGIGTLRSPISRSPSNCCLNASRMVVIGRGNVSVCPGSDSYGAAPRHPPKINVSGPLKNPFNSVCHRVQRRVPLASNPCGTTVHSVGHRLSAGENGVTIA
jgi:hypothetical protein